MRTPDLSTWLTKHEAARILGISPSTVDSWGSQKKLPRELRTTSKVREWVYDPNSVARAAAAQKAERRWKKKLKERAAREKRQGDSKARVQATPLAEVPAPEQRAAPGKDGGGKLTATFASIPVPGSGQPRMMVVFLILSLLVGILLVVAVAANKRAVDALDKRVLQLEMRGPAKEPEARPAREDHQEQP